MIEPWQLGTVVRDKHGDLWVRFYRDENFSVRWSGPNNTFKSFDKIDSPRLVHLGYVKPTEEPQLDGAVVQDQTGCVFYRIQEEYESDVKWIFPDGSGSRRWYELKQPVKILFSGIEYDPYEGVEYD